MQLLGRGATPFVHQLPLGVDVHAHEGAEHLVMQLVATGHLVVLTFAGSALLHDVPPRSLSRMYPVILSYATFRVGRSALGRSHHISKIV